MRRRGPVLAAAAVCAVVIAAGLAMDRDGEQDREAGAVALHAMIERLAEPPTPLPAFTSPSTASTTTTTTTTSTTTTSTVPPTTAAPTTVAPTTSRPPTTVAPATTVPPTTAAPPPTTAPPPPTGPVLMVGDSVMVGAAGALRAALPGRAVHIDAAVARSFAAAVPALSQAAALGATGVVLHLGTNGPMTDAAFDAAMQTVAAVPRVVVVTIQLPDATYPHEAPTNDIIRRGAQRWGAAVADWNAVTNGRPDLLAKDGYHVSPTGAPVFAQVVAAALA